jgi:hypothetical protein
MQGADQHSATPRCGEGGSAALTRWVRDGVVPPQSPAIELGNPSDADPIVRDSHGIAKGGIRLPEVEAPTATITGQRNDVMEAAPGAQNFCFLFGRTLLFERATISSSIRRMTPTSIGSARQPMRSSVPGSS